MPRRTGPVSQVSEEQASLRTYGYGRKPLMHFSFFSLQQTPPLSIMMSTSSRRTRWQGYRLSTTTLPSRLGQHRSDLIAWFKSIPSFCPPLWIISRQLLGSSLKERETSLMWWEEVDVSNNKFLLCRGAFVVSQATTSMSYTPLQTASTDSMRASTWRSIGLGTLALPSYSSLSDWIPLSPRQ